MAYFLFFTVGLFPFVVINSIFAQVQSRVWLAVVRLLVLRATTC